jgi:hypothetical protein
MDSNLYGAFLSSCRFWFFAGSLFGAGKPFFVPSPLEAELTKAISEYHIWSAPLMLIA